MRACLLMSVLAIILAWAMHTWRTAWSEEQAQIREMARHRADRDAEDAEQNVVAPAVALPHPAVDGPRDETMLEASIGN